MAQMFPTLKHLKNLEVTNIKNDDIMIEILMHLPIKSVLKCKCVCKWWYNLVADPIFIFNYSCRNPHLRVAGFYVQKFLLLQMYSELQFITVDGENDDAPMPSLVFIDDERGVFIRHSCNGLMICSSFRCSEQERIYYICKPTTKQYFILPKPECRTVFGINIAFDPNISFHYHVICICDSGLLCQIKIYASDTKSWRVSGNPFDVKDVILFNRGVFWNGALHWVGKGDMSLRFDIEKEALFKMPMPLIQEGWTERRVGYFGESGGHLYLIEIYGPSTLVFDVMEMERDYSGWFIRYHLDLQALPIQYPKMVRNDAMEIHRFVFSILHLIHQPVHGNEESFLVIHIPGKFVSYNLLNNTFVELDVLLHFTYLGVNLGLEYNWEGVYPYTNSLCYL